MSSNGIEEVVDFYRFVIPLLTKSQYLLPSRKKSQCLLLASQQVAVNQRKEQMRKKQEGHDLLYEKIKVLLTE